MKDVIIARKFTLAGGTTTESHSWIIPESLKSEIKVGALVSVESLDGEEPVIVLNICEEEEMEKKPEKSVVSLIGHSDSMFQLIGEIFDNGSQELII